MFIITHVLYHRQRPPTMHSNNLTSTQPYLCFYVSTSVFSWSREGSKYLSGKNRYLLAQGIGSVIFPPYSECFGRKRLYVVSAVFFSIFCAIIGAISHPAAAAIGRIVTGFFSAAPSVVVAGSIEDIFDTRERIWLTLPYMAVTVFGIAAGPVMSTYITAAWGWYEALPTT